MAPAVIMALASAVQAVAPLIKSGIQKNRLKKLGDVERPDFEIPEAANEQLGLARSIASNRNMPGYDEALDKIDNQTNRMIGDVKAAGGNMQDIMAAMASANVGAGMAKRDLDITNAKSYLGSLQNLQGQLGSYANWQNAQQQDEMKAYNDEMARRAALDTARQQNMQNAVGSVGQGVATGLGYQMNMNMMNKMYPGATPPANLTTPNPSVVASLPGTAPTATVNPGVQPPANNTAPVTTTNTQPVATTKTTPTTFTDAEKKQALDQLAVLDADWDAGKFSSKEEFNAKRRELFASPAFLAATSPDVLQPTTNTTNLPVNSATTPQVTSQMPFTDFSQVVSRDQFVNTPYVDENLPLFSKINEGWKGREDMFGINPTDDRTLKLGKYYDWLIANQGSITPQMSAYPVMEGMYNMYKK